MKENLFNENVKNIDYRKLAISRMHYNFIPNPGGMELETWRTCSDDILAEYDDIIKNFTSGMNDETIMTTIINKFKDSHEHQLIIAKLLEDTFDEENAKAYIMNHLDDWKIITEMPFKNTGITEKVISCNRYTFVMTDEYEETIVVLRDYETELKNIF